MSHFQNILLKRHKGLKEATLCDCGQINVLCGPNNSGKTTVLECIAEQERRFVGIALNEEAVARIDDKSMEGHRWNNPRSAELYPILLRKTAAQRAIWFSNDSGLFWENLSEMWRKEFGPNARPGEQSQILKALNTEFGRFPVPTTVLVPAKRRLEARQNVNSSEEIHSSGAGVLNFLFLAKNQDTTEEIRQKFDQIRASFSEITGGSEFDIKLQPQNQIELRFGRSSSGWIHADDCGLGFRDLLVILYFGLASKFDVVLLEEPENHIHPEIQRRLLGHLKSQSEKQFFISTHSSVFLNTQYADKVFTCRLADGVRIENATSRASILTELGYSISDNLVSDLVVLCEGPKDKLVLDVFFQKMGLTERCNIKVWPLGGDIMDQLDLSVFQEAHQLIALVDGDPGSSAVRKRFVKRCEDQHIPITRLERYAMENYFSLEAIASVMKGQMPSEITELDPKKPVGEQLGFEVKKNGGKIAERMALEDLKGTDLERFLRQVQGMVANSITR